MSVSKGISFQFSFRYKQMAKTWKEQERKNLANKFDAQGRSLLSLEEERQAEKRKDDKMMKEIMPQLEKSLFSNYFNNYMKN